MIITLGKKGIIMVYFYIFIFMAGLLFQSQSQAQWLQSDKMEKQTIKLYFVIPKDKVTYQKEGRMTSCEDRIVPLELEINTYPQFMINTALQNLFGARTETVAKIMDSEFAYNPLKKSQIRVGSVKMPKYQNIVNLIGNLVYKDKCELEAIQTQIRDTLAQFDSSAEITLNGSAENFNCMGVPKHLCKGSLQVIDLNDPKVLNDPTIIDHNPRAKIY